MTYLKPLGFLIVLSVAFVSCSAPNSQDEEQPESDIQRPTQESWNSTITLSKLENRNSDVYADHILQFDEPERIILDGNVRAELYEDNEHTSTLTADSAIVMREENIMHAFGNVVAKSDSGVTLFTERLAYSQKSEKITSDTTVTVTTETDTLHGVGFQSNSALSEWEILKPWGVTRRQFQDE